MHDGRADVRTCGQAAASAPSRAPSHQFSASVRCALSARKRGPSPHPKRSNEGRVEQQRGEELELARVWPASICHAEMRLRACAAPASRPPAASRSTYPGVLERDPDLARRMRTFCESLRRWERCVQLDGGHRHTDARQVGSRKPPASAPRRGSHVARVGRRIPKHLALARERQGMAGRVPGPVLAECESLPGLPYVPRPEVHQVHQVHRSTRRKVGAYRPITHQAARRTCAAIVGCDCWKRPDVLHRSSSGAGQPRCGPKFCASSNTRFGFDVCRSLLASAAETGGEVNELARR